MRGERTKESRRGADASDVSAMMGIRRRELKSTRAREASADEGKWRNVGNAKAETV